MKFTHRSLVLIAILSAVVFQCPDASAAQPDSYFSLKGTSYLWTIFTNPVESLGRFLTNRPTAAEEQHVLPQKYGVASSDEMVVYWIRSNHTVSDRAGERPFLVDPESSWLRQNPVLSLLTLGNRTSQRNLDAAYRMGAYGRPYSVLFHSYNKDNSVLVCVKMDGPSMLVYGVSWLINIPQKFLNQVAYYTRPNSEVGWTPVIDIALAPLVLAFEFCFGVVFTAVGVVLGCLTHPIDSVTSLGGMLWYIIPLVLTALWGIVVGIIGIGANLFSVIGLLKTALVVVVCGVFWSGTAKSAT